MAPEPRIWTFDTINDAYEKIVEMFIGSPDSFIDGKHPRMVWTLNCTIIVQRPLPELDLVQVGFRNEKRWWKFIRDYTDAEGFQSFLQRLTASRPAAETGYTCPVKFAHQHGNCMIGMSGRNTPPRITVYSRVTKWVPVGALDLSMGALVCQYLARQLGIKTVPLIWHIGQLCFYVEESIPYLMRTGRDVTWIDDPGNRSQPPNFLTRRLQNKIDKGRRNFTSKRGPIRRLYQKVYAIHMGETTWVPYFPTLPTVWPDVPEFVDDDEDDEEDD